MNGAASRLLATMSYMASGALHYCVWRLYIGLEIPCISHRYCSLRPVIVRKFLFVT